MSTTTLSVQSMHFPTAENWESIVERHRQRRPNWRCKTDISWPLWTKELALCESCNMSSRWEMRHRSSHLQFNSVLFATYNTIQTENARKGKNVYGV